MSESSLAAVDACAPARTPAQTSSVHCSQNKKSKRGKVLRSQTAGECIEGQIYEREEFAGRVIVDPGSRRRCNVEEIACEGDACGGRWDRRRYRHADGSTEPGFRGERFYPRYYTVDARRRRDELPNGKVLEPVRRRFCFDCWCEQVLALERRIEADEDSLDPAELEARERDAQTAARADAAELLDYGGMQMTEAKLEPESIPALRAQIQEYMAATEHSVELTLKFG